MTLSPAWLDELRARTLLSAVIAPSVKLIRAGREYKACCPFHDEKTPSFTVNDEKGFYHCFGCGAHGDAIGFLTDQRGLPFMDAVKELAARAGMDVPAPDPKAKERAERTASLTDVMAACQAFYVEQLQGIGGGGARDYLAGRDIGPQTIESFGFGFAPDSRNALKKALLHLGEDRLVETGMLIRPDQGESYDRFRGRLMIPIRDARGRVIAFGGRLLDEARPSAVETAPGSSAAPKYLNSPDTPLFDKGRTLYNLDRAGPASRQAKRLIVVEGYMDVIGCHRAGIDEVVAPNGTAVTEAQLTRMWRLDPAPILCFDGDSAGRKAAIRAATRALAMLGPERTLRFVELPPGQDPDDLVRSAASPEQGREAFEALLAEPEPLDQRLWRHERDAAPLATPEARAGFRQRLVEHAQAIGDPELRRLYRDQWLTRFNEEFGPARRHQQYRGRQPNRFDRKTGRWVPPAQPASDTARRIASCGIDT
ncbi:MAG TPA: DNA primase, partial [Sphingomicrobium sp.]|nr:DNA primase [Sphingomicrobium sp.]